MYIFESLSSLVKKLLNNYFAASQHLSFCSVIILKLWHFSKIVVYCVGSIQMLIRFSQAIWKFEEVLLRVDCEYGIIECTSLIMEPMFDSYVSLGKIMSRTSSQYITSTHRLIAVLICFGYFVPPSPRLFIAKGM